MAESGGELKPPRTRPANRELEHAARFSRHTNFEKTRMTRRQKFITRLVAPAILTGGLAGYYVEPVATTPVGKTIRETVAMLPYIGDKRVGSSYDDKSYPVGLRTYVIGDQSAKFIEPVFRDKPNSNDASSYTMQQLEDLGYDGRALQAKLVYGHPYDKRASEGVLENQSHQRQAFDWGIPDYNNLEKEKSKFGIWGKIELESEKGEKKTVYISLNFLDNLENTPQES